MNDKPGKMTLIFLLLIGIMLFFAYSNTFNSPPVLDDFHSFIHDPSLRKQSLSSEEILSLANTKFGITRWIPMVTLSWDIMIGKGELFYLHLTNLLIHLLCFFALFFLFHKLLVTPQNRDTSGRLPPPLTLAFWAASLWALNPVQTNAVTYIVQRMASLVTLFSVMSIAFYVSGRSIMVTRQTLPKGAASRFGLSGLFFLMALLSKENAAVVPLLIIITEVWFFREDLPRRALAFARKHWIWSMAVLLMFFGTFFHLWPSVQAGYAGRHFSLEERLLTQSRIIVWYIMAILWPNPRKLSLEHDVELSTSLLSPISTLGSVLLIGLLCFFSLRFRRRYPLITYGILWFFAALSVESTVIPLELIFEHRMYFASAGLTLSLVGAFHLLLSSLLDRMTERDFRKLAWSCFAITASFLSLATFARNCDWRDSLTLNRDNALKAPKNHRALANYAVALSQRGRYEEAIEQAKLAISVGKPNFESYCEAANTIVLSYYGMNDYETAVKEGERLLREKPEKSGSMALPSTWLAIGYAYNEMGKLEEAFKAVLRGLSFEQRLSMRLPHLQDAGINALHAILEKIRLSGIALDVDEDGTPDPGESGTGIWIAKLLLRMGEREKARELLLEVARKDSADGESRKLLENLVRDQEKSRLQQAKSSFEQKYLHRPFSRFNLCMAGAYYAREKKLSPKLTRIGERLLDQALKLKPDSADAHLLKGWYHFERNEMEDALREAQRAIHIDPDFAKAWLGLGFFLARANKPQEAVEAFGKAMELYPCNPHYLAIKDITFQLLSSLKDQTVESPSPEAPRSSS